MKKFMLICILTFISFYGLSSGYIISPLYQYTNRISNIVEVNTIEIKKIENTHTCFNGDTIYYPTKYIYRFKVKNTFFGATKNDTVISASFQLPSIVDLDDSCRVSNGYWMCIPWMGFKTELKKDDKVVLFLEDISDNWSSGYRIIAGYRTASLSNDIDLYLKYFNDFKFYDGNNNACKKIIRIGFDKKTHNLVLYRYNDNSLIVVNKNHNLIERFEIPKNIELELNEKFEIKIKRKTIKINNQNVDDVIEFPKIKEK